MLYNLVKVSAKCQPQPESDTGLPIEPRAEEMAIDQGIRFIASLISEKVLVRPVKYPQISHRCN